MNKAVNKRSKGAVYGKAINTKTRDILLRVPY